VSFVEQTTGRTIPPQDMTLENFDTIERIHRYVAAHGLPDEQV
jgi:hypothetical protein